MNKKSLVDHLSDSIGEWVKKNKPPKLSLKTLKSGKSSRSCRVEYFIFNEETGRYEPLEKITQRNKK